jgi:type III pantothenate kinase
VFRGDTLVHSWRLTTIRERTSDELGILLTDLCNRNEIHQRDITGIVIASVVPPLDRHAGHDGHRIFGRVPLLFEPAVNAGIPILIDNPAEVGADRIVNSIAAFASYRQRPAIIVIDFGTATTFDAVSAKGEYLGGVICPGPQCPRMRSCSGTAKLPRIDVRKPPRVIGTNTIGPRCRRGLFWGYRRHGRGTRAPHESRAGRRRSRVRDRRTRDNRARPSRTDIEHVDLN